MKIPCGFSIWTDKYDEKCLQKCGAGEMRNDGAGKGADQNSRQQLVYHGPTHRLMAVMHPRAGNSAGNNGRHRCGQRHVNEAISRKTLRRERERENRYHYGAATDAQQAGKKTDKNTNSQIYQPECGIH